MSTMNYRNKKSCTEGGKQVIYLEKKHEVQKGVLKF
jgi:hypothetical protein